MSWEAQTMQKLWTILLCQLAINNIYQAVRASLCLGGEDIFATVKENSPTGEFIANVSIAGDLEPNGIRLCLTGDNADWFFLDEKMVRLNSSSSRELDREVHGSVLMAALTCYEDETLQSEYRIMVEVLNENDNRPVFVEETIQPVDISELAVVNSVVFIVKASDADDDTIIYVIDKSLPDSSFFRIDLPNSGNVILSKPLDYETKTLMQLVIYAVEMTTKEKYNTSALITVNVLDGDDQYPQFQPCSYLSQDSIHYVCTNPIYTVNITDADENITLHFSPGPIHAVDGDRGLETPLLYTILSGEDNGRFQIDNRSGEITLLRAVENRLLTSTLKLQVMASQVDDPKKYTVVTALAHVLAKNHFPPQFSSSTYKGFITENADSSSLVSTYGNQALVLEAVDHDFTDGINPKVYYALRPKSNHTRLYHITQDGHLIARANQLQAFENHYLEVTATDQESGEVTRTSVDIVVLQKGQQVPHSPFEVSQEYGFDTDTMLAGGVTGVVLLLLGASLCVLLWLVKRGQQQKDPADRAAVAQGKHPNVSLKWFQLVNSRRSIPLMEEVSYHNRAYMDYDCCNAAESSKHALYVNKEDIGCGNGVSRNGESPKLLNNVSVFVISESAQGSLSRSVVANGKLSDRSSKLVSLTDEVLPKELEPANNWRFRSVEVQTEDSTAGWSGAKQRMSEEEYCNEEEEIENPYKSMSPVICTSDEDGCSGSDELNNSPCYNYQGRGEKSRYMDTETRGSLYQSQQRQLKSWSSRSINGNPQASEYHITKCGPYIRAGSL